MDGPKYVASYLGIHHGSIEESKIAYRETDFPEHSPIYTVCLVSCEKEEKVQGRNAL
jgi:hypothetical protein